MSRVTPSTSFRAVVLGRPASLVDVSGAGEYLALKCVTVDLAAVTVMFLLM